MRKVQVTVWVYASQSPAGEVTRIRALAPEADASIASQSGQTEAGTGVGSGRLVQNYQIHSNIRNNRYLLLLPTLAQQTENAAASPDNDSSN